jgi:hypothetical protein
MATNYGSPPIVTRGLIWKVDAANNSKNINAGGSNSIVGDTSTTGFSGSLEGGMARVTSTPQYWEFDGDNDYIQFAANGAIGGSDVLSLYGKTTATFEFWIAPDYTGDTYQRIISKSNTGGGGYGGYALILNSKNLSMYIDNGGAGGVIVVNYTTTAAAGEWLHVVVTKGGTTHAIYENGISKATNTATATFVNTASGLRLGSWIHSTGREYNGKLAVAGIHDVALSAEEVLQNYNALKGRFE